MEHIKFNHSKKNHEKNPEEPVMLPEKSTIESLPFATRQQLKKEIERSKEYQEYQQQKVNFETLDRLLEEAAMFPVNVEKQEASQTAKEILSAHIENVKKAVHSYYQKIEGLETLMKIQRERLDEEDFENWLHEQDRHRGQIHDVLIDSLKILTRFCVNQNEHLKVKTLFSLTGKSFPQNKFFSAAELNDRNFIGDWAFRVEKGRRMKEVHDQIEKQIVTEKIKKPE